jgi:hypothetical protein
MVKERKKEGKKERIRKKRQVAISIIQLLLFFFMF